MKPPRRRIDNIIGSPTIFKRIIIMKHKESEDYYNEETLIQRVPNDGREEINIEPIDWDDL